tara:strand:+ start:23 stop:409 length:387 start_codon:yes stop_codon:yes gene_type:complete
MGQQITELILTVLMVMGIGKISETIQPKQYYAVLESGKIMQVEVSRFNRYACPKNCSIGHFHRVHVSKDHQLNHPESIQMMVEDEKKLLPLSIENHKIVDFFEIKTEKNKKKKGPRMPIQFGKQFPWL